jgi:hypothetical protein
MLSTSKALELKSQHATLRNLMDACEEVSGLKIA